ncbi:hypothetical protein CAEBREN_07647 [Caenorhabditis brenneri]|uniref:Nuclear receptor domain-containing protein n=1 Tax=Caenorhabditis brenneri TaxID=135651 RepID=G0PBE3_CAEBE|nr:hypothetical protein CAEBREN_07647 [Caenorhabditis brenneri]
MNSASLGTLPFNISGDSNMNPNIANMNYLASLPPTPSSPDQSSSQPSSSSSASPSSSNPICKICGGQCRSKKGVGSFICKSCREFFRTAVLNDYTFRCARIGRCDVDVDKIKKYQQCRACRMEKLLEFGLDPKDVLKNQRVKRPKEIKTPERKQPEPFCFAVPNVVEEPPRIKFGTDPIVQIQLLHTQWIFISFLTSCENGAHLLDLNEEMSNVAHAFNAMNLSSYEVRAMKSVLLFMMKGPDGTFSYQNNLDDSLEDLDRAVGPDSDRFGNILLLLGTIIWLPLAGIEKLFNATVVELIPKHV